MANQIVKDTLHPENEKGVDIYPKTSLDQVEGYVEEREDIDKKINDTNEKITTGLSTKVDKATVNFDNSPGTIPIRGENNRVKVGSATTNDDAINLKQGKTLFPNATTGTTNKIDSVFGMSLTEIVKCPVDSLLAKVTSPIITISALETATNGTISAQDLATLQGNKNAMILFANEYYYLADDQHTSGYLTYSHVGVENGVQWIKSITITIASLSWVKTVDSVGKAKLYKHSIGPSPQTLFIISNRNESYTPTTLTTDITSGNIYNIYYCSYVDEQKYNFFNVLKISPTINSDCYTFYVLIGNEITKKEVIPLSAPDIVTEL